MKKSIIIIIISVIFISSIFIYKHKKSNEIIEIEFALFSGSNWDVPLARCYRLYDEAILKFENENPNIKINYRSGTLKKDYSEWLAQKILKGKEPDVFIVLNEDFNTLSSIGVLKDLSKFIEKDTTFNLEDYFTKALETGVYDGKRYALPIQIVPSLMAVNVTLLNNEGIQVPSNDWTWEDFYNICKAVTKDTDGDNIIDQFGVYGYEWEQAIYSNGQTLFDKEGKSIVYEDEAMKEVVELLSKLKELNKGYKVKAVDFDKGNVAFRPFTLAEYRAYKGYPYRIKKYSGFEWEYIKFPKGPRGNNISESNTLLIGMSSRTKEEEAAWKFLKFLISDEETQKNIWEYTNGMLANKKYAEEIFEAIDTESQEILSFDLLTNIIEESTIEPRFRKYSQLINTMNQILYIGINEENNSDDIVKKLRSEINHILKEQ